MIVVVLSLRCAFVRQLIEDAALILLRDVFTEYKASVLRGFSSTYTLVKNV